MAMKKKSKTSTKTDDETKRIAEQHWAWIEGLWESMPDDTVFGLAATEYLYKAAFVHGWKHALQYIEEVKPCQNTSQNFTRQ